MISVHLAIFLFAFILYFFRQKRERERTQVVLFNASTTGTNNTHAQGLFRPILKDNIDSVVLLSK